MRRKSFVFGAAAICALAVVVVLRVHFFPTRNWGSLATKSVRVNTPSLVAARPATVIGARTPVVPLAFNSPSRPASATGQGTTAPQADAAHDRFARWAALYFSASTADDKASLLAQGKELAAARREALAALIQVDPKRALELAAPWQWREELPPEIASLLEQRVSGRGKYSVFGAVPLEGQNEFVGPILRYATVDSVAYYAFVYGRRLHQVTTPNTAL